LGVSGSLRAASANSNLLRAAAALAPADVRVTLYEGLAALPHFNPDVEAISSPDRSPTGARKWVPRMPS
jgi:chromate reductase